MARKRVPNSTQAEVLLQSRRRCCICFGLNRDEEVKNGQIAHLDGDRNNNAIANLAYLCFDHHEEYDSRTSQRKGLKRAEVVVYRDELHYCFENWAARLHRDELLSFLAFAAADLDSMASAAIKAATSTVFYGESLAYEVLTQDEFDSCDMDLWVPYLSTLEYFASWGWLTFSYEERETEGDEGRTYFTIDRKPVCDEIAKKVDKIIRANGGKYTSNIIY